MSAEDNVNRGYAYDCADASCASEYLWPQLTTMIRSELPVGERIFELGCGNGATAEMLGNLGYRVVGVDPSEEGIRIARANHPTAQLEAGSAYDDLATTYGQFPMVVSLEVIEHCFWPRKFAKTLYDLLTPGGLAIISTPYHGYTKNLAIALINGFDAHWSPLWEGGHIKFWSERTLGTLLSDSGFADVRFLRAGRVAVLAKSMIALARKPVAR